LTSKLACFQSRNIVLGVATKLGCEAAIHTTRTFVNNDQNSGKVLLQLDFKNAFNPVERDCILKELQCHTPLLYLYLYQCYRNPSPLFFGNNLISSSVGAQRGDLCDPMILSLAIKPIILSLDSQLNIWLFDVEILTDHPEVVLSDFKKMLNLSRETGLELNFNKCEIFCISGDTDLKVLKEFQNLAPGIKICDRGSLSLLGSPIFDQGFKYTIDKTIITVEIFYTKHFIAFSDSSILVETDRKANLNAKLFLFYGIAGNIVYMTMPYLYMDKCRYQREQNMVDLDIPCGLVSRCWFPFKLDYTPVFEIVFVHQFYTCTMVSVVILALTMLLCGFLMHITNQFKHLRRFIVELKFPEEILLEKLHFSVKYHTPIIT
jgi:hypothetical protein